MNDTKQPHVEIETAENASLRFAVGSIDGPRSAVWGVRVQNGHAYVFQREGRSSLKLSLHRDGNNFIKMQDEEFKAARSEGRPVPESAYTHWQSPELKLGEATDVAALVFPRHLLGPMRGFKGRYATASEEKLDQIDWVALPDDPDLSVLLNFRLIKSKAAFWRLPPEVTLLGAWNSGANEIWALTAHPFEFDIEETFGGSEPRSATTLMAKPGSLAAAKADFEGSLDFLGIAQKGDGGPGLLVIGSSIPAEVRLLD